MTGVLLAWTLHAVLIPPPSERPVAAGQTDGTRPGVAALVDDVEIPARVFDMYLRNGVEELGLDATTPDGRRQFARLRESILEELIDRALVEAEARRRGLPVDAATLDAHRARWIARLGGEAGYRAYLARHELTEREFLQVIRQEISGDLLREALTRDLRVEEREIKSFYDREHRNPQLETFFVAPETVHAAHILVAARPKAIERELQREAALSGEALAGRLADELARRRARAEEIRHEALAGVDFAALARRWSDDPGTRERGGDLGAFTRNTHPEAFDAAAFALEPGRISGVVQTDYGFHVIRVTARSPRRLRTLAEVRPEIVQRLSATRAARHLGDWLSARRRAAVIRVDSTYRFVDLSRHPQP